MAIGGCRLYDVTILLAKMRRVRESLIYTITILKISNLIFEGDSRIVIS